LSDIQPASERLVRAPWPRPDATLSNPAVEARFSQFETALSALREIRSRQNIPPKQTVEFSVHCDASTAGLLEPLEPYFLALANARAVAWGPAVESPAITATVRTANMTVHVDLEGLIDVAAERERLTKQLERLSGMVAAKQRKLSNNQFVERAPENVVQRERHNLAQMEEQLKTVRQSLDDLRKH
jgi:valyl-tRNA synthetase